MMGKPLPDKMNERKPGRHVLQPASTSVYTLGIHCSYDNCAACLVCDGKALAVADEAWAARQERGKHRSRVSFTRSSFYSIDHCLHAAGLDFADVANVAYSHDPYLLDAPNRNRKSASIAVPPGRSESGRMPESMSLLANGPNQLAGGAPAHFRERLAAIGHNGSFGWHFVEHYLAHEASAFLAAPFDDAAVLTLHGSGEKATATYGYYRRGEYARIKQVGLVSLALLCDEVMRYFGFLPIADEYKLVTLAPFGTPKYVPQFRQLINHSGQDSYRVVRADLEARFGPSRKVDASLQQHHFDVAHSMQKVLEETMGTVLHWLRERTGAANLCMAGDGVLNGALNAVSADRGPFEQVWVQPAAGNTASAIGAALWVDSRQARDALRRRRMEQAYCGPQFSDEAIDSEIEAFLRWSKLPYQKLGNVPEQTAELLAREKIVGWFQGRVEFGPRALCARSILASPMPSMHRRLSEIKDREEFNSVAPLALNAEAEKWFQNCSVAHFANVSDAMSGGRPECVAADATVRNVPATARVQTINRAENPQYYDLLKAFQRRTGFPILVNTSFNLRGEPIVCTPRDAVECFWTSPIDALVIGPFLLDKIGRSAPEM